MTTLYSWQPCYQDALLELDPAALPAKIARARSELEKRSRELIFAQDPASVAERQAVTDALNGLGAIQRLELIAPFETGGPGRPTAS
ncbi:MAG: hypothetical protein WBV36_15650 [Terriglobales bacterium]